MGSLVKLFEGQGRVWNLGKTMTGFISHNQSSVAKEKEIKTDQIRRPPTAFASFYKEKYPTLQQQYPKLRSPQIMKLASTMWKTESSSTQQRHKEEHDRKMEEYRLSVKDVPQRPNPPFIQFYLDKIGSLQYQYPKMSDRVKRASEMWKDLSIVEKQRYKSVFKNQMNTYTSNLSEEDNDLIQERKEALTSKRQRREIRKYGKVALKERPIAPKQNAYVMFLKDNAGVDTKNERFFKYMSQQWRNMSDAQKLVYKEKTNVAATTYEKDLEEWKRKYDTPPKK